MTRSKMTHSEIIAYAMAPLAPIEREHDDMMDAAAQDRRRAQRDGWETATWDGRF
jgi:hypothetical protein